MALVKISELIDAATLTGTEAYPLVQDGNTKKASPDPPGTYVEPPVDATKVIYVSPNGSDSNHGKTADKAKLTFAGALAAIGAGNPGHIKLGVGVISLGAGASLSGHACTFSGRGDATILRVTGTQVGAALDFTGYLTPSAVKTTRSIGNFAVEGDNTAGAAKKGIVFGALGQASGMRFHDISVAKTGGCPFDFGWTQCATFERLIANQPVGCYDNDVPYFMATGACNGNRFIGCGLRSTTAISTVAAGSNGAVLPQATINVASAANFSASGGTAYVAHAGGIEAITYTGKTATSLTGCSGGTGTLATGDNVIADPDAAGGLVRFRDDSAFAPERNLFLAWWTEYMHLPTNGSIFQIQGNLNYIDFPEWFDCSKVVGATGTAYIRFTPTSGVPVAETGGNMVKGVIPGTSGGLSIDRGVYLGQSRNLVEGIKGFNGGNVEIGPGVKVSAIHLMGQESGSTNHGGMPDGVVDNSGNYDNYWLDGPSGIEVRGLLRLAINANGALEIRRRDGSSAGLDFNSASSAGLFSTAANRLYFRAAQHEFRELAGTALAQVLASADTTEGNTALILGRKSGGVFAVQQVSFGAADSGGAGFRVLRIPN